ncbi:MAG: hypothetical protein R2737_01130 [Candidatus Nanopelagicales bacterium]
MMRRRRTLVLPLTGLLAAGVLVGGCSAKSDEAVAWAGAECTAVANVYLSSRLLASLVPEASGIDDASLALFQARLGDAVSAVSDAVIRESQQLQSAPGELADAIAPIQGASAAVSDSMQKSGTALGALAGAPDASAADAAAPAAITAANDVRDSATALATAVAEVTAANDTFQAAPYCASTFSDPASLPTAVPSS